MPTVREHLCGVAAEISDGALASINSLEQWKAQRPQRYRRHLEMQGLAGGELPPVSERCDLNVVTTGKLERDDVVIEKFHFESLPRLYVTANLYLPRKLEAPAPAVLYLCGHSRVQKVQYQTHARRWAQLGFVCLIMDTIEFGEGPGDHHGIYNRGQFQWISRGYTPGGVEMWNAIRAIDLLQQRQEVDPERIGVTGNSGGGAVTWWVAAADERVKVAAPACGTGTIRSQVIDRCWDGQCECLWFNNTYRWDQCEVGALVAPRPLLIASADRDDIYSIESIQEYYGKVRRIYDLYGAGAEDCQLVATPGPHGYHPTSRKKIFALFLKHLMQREVPWEEIGDIEPAKEEEAVLRVYVNGPPDDERTATIQDDFIPLAPPPQIQDAAGLKAVRSRLLEQLREKTFGHFPAAPCPLQCRIMYEYLTGGGTLNQRFEYLSEPDVRLNGLLMRPAASREGNAPALLYLQEPEAGRWDFHGLTGKFDPRWARMYVNPRGTGETSWGRELEWHMRRMAALTGRTVASMQVYDALRALEVLRGQEGIDPQRIALAGKGRMAAVALYAALLDGRLESVVLIDPPPSQDLDDEDGGQGIEMINCLQFTDLPQVAGLIWPAELVFIGPRPASYGWAEQVHRKLGGRVVHALELGRWHPRPRAVARGEL